MPYDFRGVRNSKGWWIPSPKPTKDVTKGLQQVDEQSAIPVQELPTFRTFSTLNLYLLGQRSIIGVTVCTHPMHRGGGRHLRGRDEGGEGERGCPEAMMTDRGAD